MLREKIVNGDACLIYPINEEESVQSFHAGMLATHPELPAIKSLCTYFDGEAHLVFSTMDRVTLRELMIDQRRLDLARALRLIAASVRELMAHQLNPENMLFQDRYIFFDAKCDRALLIYLPLKTTPRKAQEGLSAMILSLIEGHIESGKDVSDPLYLKLLVMLRQPNVGFRSLIDLLAEESADAETWHPMPKAPLGEAPLKPDAHILGQKPALKSAETALHEQNPRQLHSKPKHTAIKLVLPKRIHKKWALALVPAAVLTGLWLLPGLQLSTRVGMSLIVFSGGLYALQMNKRFPLTRQPAAKPAFAPFSGTDSASAAGYDSAPAAESGYLQFQNMVQEAAGAEGTKRSENTVLLNTGEGGGVLMVRGAGEPRFYNLEKEIITIGRNPSVCDIVIEDASVGRVHAEIHVNHRQCYIKDVQSLNGTSLNGRRIQAGQYVELKSGDQIKFGVREAVFT